MDISGAMRQITKPSLPSEPKPSKKGSWTFWVKILLSLGLLALVLLFVDLGEVAHIVARANLWFTFATMLLIWIDRGLMAYKWSPLLRALDVHVPFFILFRLYSVAALVGILLPLPMGQEAFRVYSLSRYRVSARTVVASIIAERIIGFVAVLIFAAFSLGLAFYLMRDQWFEVAGLALPLAVGGVAITALVAAVLAVRKNWTGRLVGWFIAHPIADKLYQVYLNFYEFSNHHRTIAIVSAWTMLEQLAPVAAAFLLVRALHINVSFLELAAIVPLVVLAIRIPISFEGFGVQEGLYVGLLALVGVPAVEALVLSAFMRVLHLVCALPWGIHYLLTGSQEVLLNQHTTRVKPE